MTESRTLYLNQDKKVPILETLVEATRLDEEIWSAAEAYAAMCRGMQHFKIIGPHTLSI